MEGISGRYADTDSMFIHCRGFRREEAFAIGHRLERGKSWREFSVEQISGLFPAPITLKLEKVYQPTLLVTKKRYAGFCFTSPTAEPLSDSSRRFILVWREKASR